MRIKEKVAVGGAKSLRRLVGRVSFVLNKKNIGRLYISSKITQFFHF